MWFQVVEEGNYYYITEFHANQRNSQSWLFDLKLSIISAWHKLWHRN